MRLFCLLMVILTVNDISCDNTIGNATMKSGYTSCTLNNITDSSKIKSSCESDTTDLFFRDSHFHLFPHVFEYYQNLNSVDLTNAGIQRIETTTFDGAIHLKYLRMDGSNIATLQNSIFSRANNLVSFEMQNSSISTVEEHAFQGLSSLRKLDLSFNNILHLKAEIFQPLSQLETLRITNNRIEIIDEDLFKYNVNLRYVYFSSNKIIAIEQEAFIHTKLIDLDLGFNQLANVDLSTMKHLQILTVNNNKLHILSIPPTADQIHAENNSISLIRSEESNKLQKLFLQSNYLSNLQSLAPLSKLKFLDLSKNHLRNIQFSDLKSLTQLRELKLTGNKLPEIKVNDVITNLKNLSVIELSTKHWSKSYIDELEKELHDKHEIILGQDRSDISDDDAKIVTSSVPPSTVTTSHLPTTTMYPTEPPNTQNVEKRLEEINKRLIDLESEKSNKSANAKKIDDRLKEMEEEYDAISSTSKAHTAWIAIIYVACLIGVLYVAFVYFRGCTAARNYVRTPLSEMLTGDDL